MQKKHKAERFVYVLEPLISTTGGRFHFITVQGRHLFKKTTFTVSTLPRAWLEPRANRMLVMKALRQITSMGRAVHSPRPRSRRLPFQSTMQCFGLTNNKRWYILYFG